MPDDEAPSNVNPLQMALQRLDQVAKRMKLVPSMHEILKFPRRSLEVSVPMRMDTGRVHVLTGFRVQPWRAGGFAAPPGSAKSAAETRTRRCFRGQVTLIRHGFDEGTNTEL